MVSMTWVIEHDVLSLVHVGNITHVFVHFRHVKNGIKSEIASG